MTKIRLQNTENTYKGIYPTVFKKINNTDISVNPFQSYKSWSVVSGSSTSSLLPLQGVYTDSNILPAIGSELTFNDASNINGSLQSVTYFSINHLYYKYKNDPMKTYGPTDINRTKKFLYQTASILSIPQNKIGEGIKPGSFVFTGSYSIGAIYSSSYYGTGSYGTITPLYIKSDRYGNLYDASYNTSSNITDVTFYEGFNEYFDTNRITRSYKNISFVNGVTTINGFSGSIGLAAELSASSYMYTDIPGYYDRDHDYAIAFFINPSNSVTSTIIATKASSSLTPQYPFRIEHVSGSKINFIVAGSTSFKTQLTSSQLTTNSWSHVVCQKTGSNMEIYIDGVLNNSVSSTMLSVPNGPFTASARFDNTDNLRIGGFGTDSVQAKLDEFRIYNKALSATQVGYIADRNEGGTLLQSQYCGNVFDKQGLVVISSPDYRFNGLIYSPYTASYRSTVTINELSIVTKLDAGDFNMSSNITLTKDDDETYYSFVTGSTFAPYITTVGLYNDAGQLLAVAKLAQPIRKRSDVDMNFLIRIDLDRNLK